MNAYKLTLLGLTLAAGSLACAGTAQAYWGWSQGYPVYAGGPYYRTRYIPNSERYAPAYEQGALFHEPYHTGPQYRHGVQTNPYFRGPIYHVPTYLGPTYGGSTTPYRPGIDYDLAPAAAGAHRGY